jgi:Holliday junction resolvase-like predicted endonuclease
MNLGIEPMLLQIGPCLSSQIVKELTKRGLTAAAARKRVSRAKGGIKRLSGVSFPNRECFLFLDGQFGTADFLERLCDAFKESSSSYGRALVGLAARGGVMPLQHFPVATGLPVEKAIGQVPHAAVEQKLLDLRLIVRTIGEEGDYVSLWDHSSSNARRRAAVLVEDITLGMIKPWLIKVGWTSSGVVKVRSPNSLPSFGQFRWDLVGPSYLACIRTHRKGKLVNGFILGDILLDRTVTVEDLRPFMSKWDVLLHQRRGLQFQPLIIADRLAPEALNQLRARGCFLAMPATLFGEEVARQLSDLVTTVEHAAAAIADNPKVVFDLLSKLAKIEGAALNLRGIVVELMIAHLFKTQGYEIEIRQQVASESGERAEIDVKAANRKEVVCVECKGKGRTSLVNAAEIRQWLDKPLVRIKSWLKQTATLPESRRFEFYTSTDYAEDAKELIANIKATHINQPISFFNGADIINKLRDHKETALVDIFREQFLAK